MNAKHMLVKAVETFAAKIHDDTEGNWLYADLENFIRDLKDLGEFARHEVVTKSRKVISTMHYPEGWKPEPEVREEVKEQKENKVETKTEIVEELKADPAPKTKKAAKQAENNKE